MKILVTGGTGFIGKRFVKEVAPLVESMYLLVRGQSFDKAKVMFAEFDNVFLVRGDILDLDLCSAVIQDNDIVNNVDSIIHFAGKYDLEASAMESYTHNVMGTQNILTIAKQLYNLKVFHHVSSYVANGVMKGKVDENNLNIDGKFLDHYSRSKMQSEYIVREANLGSAKKRIYRPGIVVGDSSSGDIEKIDGPYYFLKMMLEHTYMQNIVTQIKGFPIPMDGRATFPIVPVDLLVGWMREFVLTPNMKEEIRTYHLIPENTISVKTFAEKSLEFLGIDVPVLPLPKLKLYGRILPKIGLPKQLIPHMYSHAKYSIKNRKEDYPQMNELTFDSYSQALFQGGKDFLIVQGQAQ